MMASLTFLLTGRIGNGKSSTGNSILGKKVFTPQSSYVSGSTTIAKDTSNIDGTHVTVVDGFDIDDVNYNRKKGKKLLKKLVKNMTDKCEIRDPIIVLVLKYGIRFTKQEKDAVDLIRYTFGQNVLKSNGVIVMSHGDNFDMDDGACTFQNWCRNQTGDVKPLFEECESRIVLFNNKAKEPEAQKQVQEFMKKVKKIREPEPFLKQSEQSKQSKQSKLCSIL